MVTSLLYGACIASVISWSLLFAPLPATAADAPNAQPTPCVGAATPAAGKSSAAGVAAAAPGPKSSAAPVAEPTCAPNLKRWALKFAPDYGLSIGSGDNASLVKPQTSGLGSSYALTYKLNHRTGEADGDELRLGFVRSFSNDTSDKVLRNLVGSLNARSIRAITDTVKLTKEFDGPEVERFEVELGYAYRHPSCCGDANATFNPAGEFHTYYASVDYYFGPVAIIGFQDPNNASPTRYSTS